MQQSVSMSTMTCTMMSLACSLDATWHVSIIFSKKLPRVPFLNIMLLPASKKMREICISLRYED